MISWGQWGRSNLFIFEIWFFFFFLTFIAYLQIDYHRGGEGEESLNCFIMKLQHVALTLFYSCITHKHKIVINWNFGFKLINVYSVSNTKGPQALSSWKLRRALWKANVWARKALKNSGYQLMHCQSKIFKHWSYKILDLDNFLWAHKHLWGPLKR